MKGGDTQTSRNALQNRPVVLGKKSDAGEERRKPLLRFLRGSEPANKKPISWPEIRECLTRPGRRTTDVILVTAEALDPLLTDYRPRGGRR